MIFKLFKIFFSNIFSFGEGLDSNKKGGKEIVKKILLGLLFAYLIVAFGFMYSLTMLSVYTYLAQVNQTVLMPLIGLLMAVFVIFFFGFTSVATNYYTGTGDEQLLSMPIKPAHLFAAKFGVSFVTDAVLGLFLFSITAGIYGYNEGLLKNPLFYLGTIVTDLTFSILVIAVIYILLIVILLLIPAFRKKNILNGIASVLIIVFVVVFSLGNSKITVTQSAGGTDRVAEMLAPAINSLVNNSDSFSLVIFFAGAIRGQILPILIQLVITAVVIFGIIPVCGRCYFKTLNGFSDIKSKRLSDEKINQVIDKDVHSQSIFSALLWRDIKTVLREPTFFANGPLMIFLLPVIMIISFLVGLAGASTGNLIDEIRTDAIGLFANASPEDLSKISFYVSVFSAAFCIFMGNSSSIAVSSFSREGKALYDLKAMPIQNNIIAKVKFTHSYIYIVISDLVISTILILISLFLHLPLSISQMASIIINMSLINFAISLLLVIVDMFIDTMHPKLTWENPVAAFKQNMNAVIAIFIGMGIAGILVLAGFLLPKNQLGILIIVIVFGVIGFITGAGYFRYAEKRISKM